MARSRSPTRVVSAENLGIIRDAVSVSGHGVTWGFGIAKFATNTGFGIASKCIRGPADKLELAAGANGVSSILRGVDHVVGVAHKATTICQDVAHAITHTSLEITKAGLSAAGAKEGELLRIALGEETAEVIIVVERITRQFASPLLRVPLPDLLITARAWAAMQRAATTVDLTANERQYTVLPQHTERWMRFSAATFGAAWLAGLVDGPSKALFSAARMANTQNMRAPDAALACAGIEGHVEVTAFEQRTGDMFMPAYMVAVDHDIGAVVVAFRGTSSITDALVDLLCEPAPVEFGGLDGFAHSGMLRAAQRLDTALAALAEDGLVRLTPERQRRIVICGHSLGAGVAALLAALWRDAGRFPGVDVQCMAFACPQVLDQQLAAALSNHTTSVVVGDDMVPRLSLASAMDLREVLLRLSDPEAFGLPEVFAANEVLAAEARGDTGTLEVAYAAIRRAAFMSSKQLAPAGRLIHLAPGSIPCIASSENFNELIISRDMASAHMPHRYLAAIQELGSACAVGSPAAPFFTS